MCYRKVFLLWLSLSLPIYTIAQFDGGSGDGYMGITSNALTLDSQIINLIYEGANGDGFSLEQINSVTLDNSSLEVLFSGSNGDGFDNFTLNDVTLDNTQLISVFLGGNGDGFSLKALADVTLDNTALVTLYTGGNGDGFDELLLSSVTLDNTSLVALYEGGNGDGFSLENLINITLTNQILSVIYSGGNGDGFDMEQAVVFLEPNSACVRPPQMVGAPLTSDIQISSMTNNANVSPQDLNNAFVILRSKEKGFVITRIANPETAIGTNAIEGMIVYDTNDDCIKLYNGTTWNCIIQSCPD